MSSVTIDDNLKIKSSFQTNSGDENTAEVQKKKLLSEPMRRTSPSLVPVQTQGVTASA